MSDHKTFLVHIDGCDTREVFAYKSCSGWRAACDGVDTGVGPTPRSAVVHLASNAPHGEGRGWPVVSIIDKSDAPAHEWYFDVHGTGFSAGVREMRKVALDRLRDSGDLGEAIDSIWSVSVPPKPPVPWGGPPTIAEAEAHVARCKANHSNGAPWMRRNEANTVNPVSIVYVSGARGVIAIRMAHSNEWTKLEDFSDETKWCPIDTNCMPTER